MASLTPSALRYGRDVVIAEKVSPTARMRAISGISSAERSVDIPLAVPPLVVMADPVADRLDVGKVAHDHVAEHDMLLHDLLLLGREAAGLAEHGVGDADLSDVVEEAGDPDRADGRLIEPERSARKTA